MNNEGEAEPKASTGLDTAPSLTTSSKADAEREARHMTCAKMRDHLMVNSPIVSFMVKELRAVGCPITSDNIVCQECPPNERAGGFQPYDGGRIILCQNVLKSKASMAFTTAHEMMHLYDQCRFKVNWLDLRHHACSEIRAATLSGECKWTTEVLRRQFPGFVKHFQDCVKRRATIAVSANPSCKSEQSARQAVLQVFDSCFADTRPFDEIY